MYFPFLLFLSWELGFLARMLFSGCCPSEDACCWHASGRQPRGLWLWEVVFSSSQHASSQEGLLSGVSVHRGYLLSCKCCKSSIPAAPAWCHRLLVHNWRCLILLWETGITDFSSSHGNPRALSPWRHSPYLWQQRFLLLQAKFMSEHSGSSVGCVFRSSVGCVFRDISYSHGCSHRKAWWFESLLWLI